MAEGGGGEGRGDRAAPGGGDGGTAGVAHASRAGRGASLGVRETLLQPRRIHPGVREEGAREQNVLERRRSRAAGRQGKTEAALRGEDPPTATSGDDVDADEEDRGGVDGAGGSGTSTAVQTPSGGSTPLTSPSKPRANRGVATEQAAPVLQPEAAKERQREEEDAARARAELESRMASGGDGDNAASTSSWYWPFS